MINIGLLGSQGRMGQWVTQLLQTTYSKQAKLAAVANQNEPLEPLLRTDVVIDFSLPAGMLNLANMAIANYASLPAFVVGSTGWKIEERRILEELSKKTPVLMSSNFSMGVQSLLAMLRQLSPVMSKLGYTPVIIEKHHKHKKDSPSGTAISLQRTISPEGPGNTQVLSVRAGEVIGDHEVTFYGPADRITVGHFAQDRSIFARGAIETAIWLAGKRSQMKSPEGILSMESFFKESV